MLELPLWQFRGRRFVIAPADVLASPAEYPAQYARVLRASLAHPIRVLRYRGRPTILDGVHRLAHAVLRGSASVRGMVLSERSWESGSTAARRTIAFAKNERPRALGAASLLSRGGSERRL